MTVYKFTKNIVCTDSLSCSDRIVAAIETRFNCKVHAVNDRDDWHGGTHIIHKQGAHIVEIEFYDRDFVFAGRQFKKLSTIPTRQQVDVEIL